ncbi:tRNA-dihydrouridine synthase [Nocardia salmonicida]|uniref:tRNA-dihydrouridine synthase n=1 Tax=Nocardia salmonicida TaxID=53431 RepID=UPI0037ACB056
MKLFGRFVFQHYPYEPPYLRDHARQFREELTIPLVLLGGITDLAGMNASMAHGFEFVVIARALLREPDLVNRLVSARRRSRGASTATLYAASILTGTRCPLVGATP